MGSEEQGRPRLTAKGERTRARIVEAAAQLVYERGVAGTTLGILLAQVQRDTRLLETAVDTLLQLARSGRPEAPAGSGVPAPFR